jgi:cellulose synthase/poly-beta-1,6-N-acetylglucosamine synthase-like glycosyltransferase
MIAIILILTQISYLIANSVNLLLFIQGWRKFSTLLSARKSELLDLPMYTILLPLYKEQRIVPQLVQNIIKLNYDKNKLQVLVLLEEDDIETLTAFNELELPDYFSLLLVPDGQPRTKGRACNYALPFVKGDFLVIYDAEDNPESDQLLLAVQKFRSLPANVVCLQAWLEIANAHKNWLTRMFALEYNKQFKFLLTGINSCDLFISLGGTSNHFKVKALCELDGWNAFNVTEDAEISIRMAKLGYYSSILPSSTYEEATDNIFAWLKQRRRWHKGFMQTLLTHLMPINKTYTQLGIKNFYFMLYYFGLMMLLPLITPFLFIGLLLGFWVIDNQYINNTVIMLAWFNLYFGLFVQVSSGYIVLRAQGNVELKSLLLAFSYLLYLLLHIPATFLALYQLITRPYYWDKTEH